MLCSFSKKLMLYSFSIFHSNTFLNPLNQIKSLLLSHHHSTSALVSEILTSVLHTVQKKKTIYIWTVHIYRLTEDNVQNTHTYTQYTQCNIKT